LKIVFLNVAILYGTDSFDLGAAALWASWNAVDRHI